MDAHKRPDANPDGTAPDRTASGQAGTPVIQTPARIRQRRVLIIVENLPVPFDRRVWQEATTLRDAGYLVSVICPKGKDHRIRRALLWRFVLATHVALGRGFDVIHACNPPDNIFIVGGFRDGITLRASGGFRRSRSNATRT